MTEDYKKGILDYISGNVVVENEKANSFRDNETITNNLTTKLSELGITPSVYKIKSLTNDTLSNYILYGQYTKNSQLYTWIAILNESGTILDILTTYESGNLIEPIYCLDYDENGYIYGIDKPNNQNYYRIIQLNNLAVPIRNNFVCKLRSSYYIKSEYNTPLDIGESGTPCIKKVNGEALYYIYGYIGTSPNYKTKLIQFSNVVGTPVEWNYYEGSSFTDLNDTMNFADFIINNNDENITLDMYYVIGYSSYNLYHEYFNGESISSKPNYTFTNFITDIKIMDTNNIYLALTNRDSTQYPTIITTIEVQKISNETTEEVFSYTTTTLFTSAIPSHYIEVVNGIVFSVAANFLGGGEAICNVYNNGELIKSPDYTYTERLYKNGCIIQKIYGLYKFVLQTFEKATFPSVVIYDNQYSGESRTNYDTTLPKHVELYSGEYIKFARDLYNRQIYQNQCVSTVNIPYNYLNNIEIEPSNLISSSMTDLVNNTDMFTKNQYENLFVNFINKINVIDDDTDTLYPNAANYINENINTGNEQNNLSTFIGKVRINFTTPKIQTIQWTWNVDHYETSFTIYTSEIPETIEFISNDETTTYLTKEISNLTTNKYYTISQKLRIE